MKFLLFFLVSLSIPWAHAIFPGIPLNVVEAIKDGKPICEILSDEGKKQLETAIVETAEVLQAENQEETDIDVSCVSSSEEISDCYFCSGSGYFLKINGEFISRYVLDESKLSVQSHSSRLKEKKSLCERDKALAIKAMEIMKASTRKNMNEKNTDSGRTGFSDDDGLCSFAPSACEPGSTLLFLLQDS